MNKLTKEQILALHCELITEFGGINGLRDEGLFDSAISSPFQSFDGQQIYPTVQQKAARIGFGLIMNHPFFDGNKRTGTHVMLLMLAMNGVELEYSQKKLYEIILQIASGEASFEQLLNWVFDHEI